MAIVLVQSVLCGHNSSSFSSTGGILTCTGNFPSNTVAGNFLVGACFSNTTTQTPSMALTLTTPGLTWTPSGGISNSDVTGGQWKGVGQYNFAGNAPSISSSTTHTLSVTFGNAALGYSGAIEFALFEFSGCLQSSSILAFQDNGTTGTGTSSTPNIGTLTTTNTDLLLGLMVGETGNISAGSGYSLGATMSVMNFGQLQYGLNVPAGNIATAWSGGTEAKWALGAQAIFPAPFVPPVTPPSSFSLQKLILSVKESNIPVRGRNQ
jgi:hypothetical protein